MIINGWRITEQSNGTWIAQKGIHYKVFYTKAGAIHFAQNN